jgi:hypothetical protein
MSLSVSNTIPIASDADRRARQGHLWLPVPAPGTYSVQPTLNESTGRGTDGPRTEYFSLP